MGGAWGLGVTLYLLLKPATPAFSGRKEAPERGSGVYPSNPLGVLPG